MYSRCEGRQQLFVGASPFEAPRAALVLPQHCAGVALVSILNFFLKILESSELVAHRVPRSRSQSMIVYDADLMDALREWNTTLG
jgi:hypothetical protein